MASKSYLPWSPDQSFLLPPSPRDWLPEGHLVYFLLDVLDQLDLREIEAAIQSKDARGQRPYSPRMMVGLLIYGYCLGIRSSRKLERLTYEDVAFRVLTGGQHPDHSRISEFRRVYKASFRSLFLQVLQLCQKAGLVKLGQVAVDGTKMQGNASKHKAMSYLRMQELEQRLLWEIDQLVEKAEQVDQEEDVRLGVGQREESLPAELQRREQRLACLRAAKAALEEEARQSRAQELRDKAERARQKAQSSDKETVAQRNRTRADQLEQKARELDGGSEPAPATAMQLPRHRVKTQRDGSPAAQAQRNFTDPDSRIMKAGGTYLQGYNCQAAVESVTQIILAADVTNQCPDNGHLVPILEQVHENCGQVPKITSADSGYWAGKAAACCESLGTDAYIATGRQRHGQRDEVVLAPDGTKESPRQAMQRKLQSVEGRAIYARRKVIVEPVFGQIKEARGVRRFLLRGLESVCAEWQLICCTHNLLKLFRNRPAAAA